jgi:hypothetical protein
MPTRPIPVGFIFFADTGGIEAGHYLGVCMSRSLWPLTAAALVLAACHDPSPTVPENDPPGDEELSAIAAAPGRVKWRFKLQGDYSLHSPGVGPDGTVYVSLPNGKLYAVAPGGTQRWIFQAGLGGGVYGPVSVAADGTIYVAGLVPDPAGSGATGAIFAVTPAGTLKWKFDATGNAIIAGPNIGPDGNIYAVAEIPGIGLFSLTPAGQLRFKTGTFGEYGPLGQEIAFGTNQLYFAFDMAGLGSQPSLFGYTLAGARRFQVPNAANNSQPDVGPNGNVVIETFPTNVGLSLTSYTPAGAIVWSYYRFPGNTEEHPFVGLDNTSYTVRNLGTLLALDPAGQEKWRFVDTTIMFQPRARPQNDLLFMGGRITYGQPGYFQAVSTSGTPLWRVLLPDEPGFPPYGQLVPMTAPVFSPDGNTGYGVTDVAGDGANPYCFLYAIDLTPGTGGGNTAPAVTLAATTSTSIRVGGSVTFRGSFIDPDVGDGPWTYLWRFGNGKVSINMAAPGSNTSTRVYSTAGTYNAYVTVTDARGAVGKSNVIVVRVQ